MSKTITSTADNEDHGGSIIRQGNMHSFRCRCGWLGPKRMTVAMAGHDGVDHLYEQANDEA